MDNKAVLIEQLQLAASRVESWPTWKKLVYERTSSAERYIQERRTAPLEVERIVDAMAAGK